MKRINHILITAMVLVAVAMFANANIPPAPAGLDNDTGNYWVNYTWSKDTDHPDNENVTDSFNVSMNGTWYNGTTTFLNKSVGQGGWANITVWAYNATGNGNMSAGSVGDNVQAPAMVDNPCTIMHPDSETLMGWIARYNAAPAINISGEGVMTLPDNYSVLDHLDYNATERDQWLCGNCWVWAGTGCIEVAHDVENDVFDRLSIQYLNSLYYDGNLTGAGHACCGGNLGNFTDFYSVNTTFAVPWNNTNASWQDWNIGCTDSTNVPADSISTTPHYTITRIEERTITTQRVGNAIAIENIKSVLASDNAVWFAFYLPNNADWNNFQTFWNNNAETDLWSPDYSCGHTWVDGEGGGHAVLCVGYYDGPETEPYWIMLNSWGNSTNRPNGLFRMNMDINYDCYFVDGGNYYSLYWQMLDIDFAVPTPTDLRNTTGNYWVNYTWAAGTGIVTDGYNVSMNGTWHNRTKTFLNSSVGAGNWSNITVWAWNATGNGNMSEGNISDNVQAPTAPAITSWGNNKTNDALTTITINESESVRFNATANQTITTWNWYNNGTDQLSNFDNYTTSWSVNGTNTVSVNATNTNGTSGTKIWTVTVNDIMAPAQVTNLTNDTTTATTVDLSWTANTERDLVGYKVYKNGTLIDSPTHAYYNVTNLDPSTTYEFNVSAYDDNDLEGENASMTMTTAAIVHPAPAIASWSNNKTNNNSATLTINESEPVRFNATANQTINTWHWYNNGTDQLSNFDNYTTSWSVNGTNTVSVNATNANGTSNTKTWTITVNDITAPKQVQGLTNDTTTATTVDLSWDANTEADLVEYRVYRNGKLLGSPAHTYYNVTGLSSSTTYEFNVSAYDDNGLEGENASIVVTTAVGPLHHINVTPTAWTLNINESQDFTAAGCDQNNGTIQGLVFAWDRSDVYIGNFTLVNDTTTNFTAEHVGITYITASNGSSVISDQVQVIVNAPTNNTNVTNKTAFTATSGGATVTGTFSNNLTGWINTTAIGNATNSSEVNQSHPRSGLGSGDKVVSGVTINVSDGSNIRSELAARNGTIRIKICYNVTTLVALGIDASTLAIWKYDNATEKWVKQSSTTTSEGCIYADVHHLCTFGLVGSKATPSGGGSSGGSGTYPPGWFGTPTPTVTATKAPAAPATATAAPPGDKVTPAPTKAKPAAAKTAAPAAEGTTAGDAKKGAPGFTAVFAIAGMLAIAYLVMRRRE